jgi:hypothetical protein
MRSAPSLKPDVTVLKKRTEGAELFAPLRLAVRNLTVTDEASYAVADAHLGKILNARAIWLSKMEPILDPAKETMAAAKRTLDAARALFNEFDQPLGELALQVKGVMRDYKLAEAAEAERLEREKAEKARQLQAKLDEQKQKEEQARTPQMATRLAVKRQQTEQALAEVEDQEETRVKGSHSTDRRVRRLKLLSVRDVARGVSLGVIPIEAIEVKLTVLEALMRQNPGVEDRWPGVEAFMDVVIAKR